MLISDPLKNYASQNIMLIQRLKEIKKKYVEDFFCDFGINDLFNRVAVSDDSLARINFASLNFAKSPLLILGKQTFSNI